MRDIARILLGTIPGAEERRVLVFRPDSDFAYSDRLVDELPSVPPDAYHDLEELYLCVAQDLEHSWYVVLEWNEQSGWYERYDPEHTDVENLNTDDFLDWHVRTCSIPASVLAVLP